MRYCKFPSELRAVRQRYRGISSSQLRRLAPICNLIANCARQKNKAIHLATTNSIDVRLFCKRFRPFDAVLPRRFVKKTLSIFARPRPLNRFVLGVVMSENLFARKAQGISSFLITCDVITGCSGGRVKCIAVKRFQSLARRAQYRIFLFRERNVILKSSACLPVFVRSRSDERSRSYSSKKVEK